MELEGRSKESWKHFYFGKEELGTRGRIRIIVETKEIYFYFKKKIWNSKEDLKNRENDLRDTFISERKNLELEGRSEES